MKKKNSNNKKLVSAAGMFLLSAAMLGSATYAWFTMNKQVTVEGMQMKAHAEEGLLINEVAAAADTNWDEKALAGDEEYVALRPASTYNVSDWWHANSLNVNNEAGYGSGSVDTTNTAKIGDTTDYYSPISGSENISEHTRGATAGSVAARTIYYKDATFGGSSGYQDGEGFYVNYKYYLKSSSTNDMTVAKDKFMVTVTATKDNAQEAKDLDKAIRVAVKIDDDILIFAPTGGDTSYSVTKNAAGSEFQAVTALNAETALGASSSNIILPKVTGDDTKHEGKLVDVYVWFEGEDQNCKSINLTETLNDYHIDLKFRIKDLEG